VLVLVICRPAADADQVEFRRLMTAEAAALRQLNSSGALTGAWSPGHPGAVLMLDVPDQTQAARLTADLPLARAGLITTEIIQLHPMDLWPASTLGRAGA
jgi:muconolactone delta-isomerase